MTFDLSSHQEKNSALHRTRSALGRFLGLIFLVGLLPADVDAQTLLDRVRNAHVTPSEPAVGQEVRFNFELNARRNFDGFTVAFDENSRVLTIRVTTTTSLNPPDPAQFFPKSIALGVLPTGTTRIVALIRDETTPFTVFFDRALQGAATTAVPVLQGTALPASVLLMLSVGIFFSARRRPA